MQAEPEYILKCTALSISMQRLHQRRAKAARLLRLFAKDVTL